MGKLGVLGIVFFVSGFILFVFGFTEFFRANYVSEEMIEEHQALLNKVTELSSDKLALENSSMSSLIMSEEEKGGFILRADELIIQFKSEIEEIENTQEWKNLAEKIRIIMIASSSLALIGIGLLFIDYLCDKKQVNEKLNQKLEGKTG